MKGDERIRTAVCALGDDSAYEPVVEWCREWQTDGLESTRCPNIAEYLIWGRLFPNEALGPRCYDCAAKHVGHRALTGSELAQSAILDLRGLVRGAVS